MLRDSNSPNSAVQAAVAKVRHVVVDCIRSSADTLSFFCLVCHLQRLEELRYLPNFLAYLSHVLVHCHQEAGTHRAVAGLLLKSALLQRQGASVTDEDATAMAYVKSTVLLGLGEPDNMIRHTAGTVVMSILYNEETGAWPEALDALTRGLSSSDENVIDVSISFGSC